VPGHEVKVKIVDDTGKEVKPGQIGEILIGGPTVMHGYYNHPKETAEVLKDSWLYTGDLGRKDKEGYLYFEGLKKEIVKVGGNTIDLHEIKKIFLLHPDVAEAYIYPKANKLWGKVLEAEIFVKKELSEKDLKIHCNKYLAPYKMPGKIKVIKI
jgi:acyl-CoA synthetase (AMP-forming)/AMP-acid ligase II